MSSQKEIEARWLNLEKNSVLKSLRAIGAKKTGSFFFREWIFAYPGWKKGNRRVRVRTDGSRHYLTYKSNATWEVDSTQEVEVRVSSPDDAVDLMKAVGVPLLRYQEKRRDTYAILAKSSLTLISGRKSRWFWKLRLLQ